MNWLRNLSLRWKLLGAFGLVLLVVAALSAYTYRASAAAEDTSTWVQHTHDVIEHADETFASLVDMQTGYRGFLLSGQDTFLEPYNAGRKAYQARLPALVQLTSDNPAQVRRWQEIERRASAWQQEVVEPGLRLRRDATSGRATLDELARQVDLGADKRHFDGLRGVFADAIAAERTLLDRRLSADAAAGARLRQVIIWGTIAAILLGAIVALVLARVLADGMSRIERAASNISSGDLRQTIDYRSEDELGRLADAFRRMIAYQNQMAGAAESIAGGRLTDAIKPQSEQDVLGIAFKRMTVNLRSLVAELQSGSHDLSTAGSQILAATSQQASGATQQSAAIAQTTATVDEVAVSSEQAVEMAEAVAQSAQHANRVAADGVVVLGDASHAISDLRFKVQSIAQNMLALSEQSQQIGEIITTVNDLADQSNLLALNAAIEASRAGEHGKGFTVVAQEIRTLAEQSKAATAQVRTILSDIQRATNAAVMATEQGTKGVDAGTELIGRAGQTIDEVAAAIRQAAQSAGQIAASVRQHSVGMEQIASAMGHINQATQQSLTATTDTRRAAQNLTELATRLNHVVAQYQL